MATTVPVNPFVTSNAAGTFVASSEGDVQGTFYDDPAVRWALKAGILSYAETLPMWGGCLVYAQIPQPQSVNILNPSANLGVQLGRATTLTKTSATGGAGFSVFNQNYASIIDPGASLVPLSASGMQVNWFPFGCGAEIAVKCDPDLVSLETGSINQQVSWDFNDQLLQPYDASTATITINSMTWANTSGGQLTGAVTNWTGATQPTAGDILNISGATNSGTGGAAAINTSFPVVSATSTGVVLAAPAAAGVFGTIGGSPVFNFGTGALGVSVLRVTTSNSMTVNWNGAVANWNYSGCTAVIKI